MKTNNVNVKVLLAVLFALGISLSVMSQPYGQRGQAGQGFHRQVPQMSQRGFSGIPDLSEDQKEQIKSLHLALAKDLQGMRAEVDVNRAKLHALLIKDQPDMKAVVKLVEETGKIDTQIQIKSIENKITVRNLLTDEQKVVFDAHGSKASNFKMQAMAQKMKRNYQGRQCFR